MFHYKIARLKFKIHGGEKKLTVLELFKLSVCSDARPVGLGLDVQSLCLVASATAFVMHEQLHGRLSLSTVGDKCAKDSFCGGFH